MKKIALTYAAGSVGGVFTALFIWLAGLTKVTIVMGVNIAPALTPDWIYSRAVWGGIWAMLFLLPVFTGSGLVGRNRHLRAILISMAPTLATLLVIFPAKTGAGFFGLGLGQLTPAFVIMFNLCWALVTHETLIRLTGNERPPVG